MATRRSSLAPPSSPSRKKFQVKRVSVIPPCDPDGDDDQGQDDDEAVEKPTFYERSLRRMTREVLPQINFYRHSLDVYRPDLEDLHNAVHFNKEVQRTPSISSCLINMR